MDYAKWNSVVTNDAGAVVAGAQVTVRETGTGALARLYDSRDGGTPKGNPFLTDANGQISFFVKGGAYTITAVNGTMTRSWTYEPIGTAQEYDIQALATYLNSGVFYFQTKAEMDAYTPLQFPAAASVLNDPSPANNGTYTNSGSGWVYGAPFPDTIARLIVTGGDANNPTATLQSGVNPAAPLVFFVDVSTPNTGAVTLNVVGLGSGSVRNVNGAVLTAGEWSGRVMLTREASGQYKMLNDAASASSAAASASSANASADVATTKAAEASVSAATATAKANEASASASTATTKASEAAASASTASTGASTATTKANEASASASSASGSATTATNKASEASTSATGAANSATTATNKAAEATTQANRAETEADRAAAAAGGAVHAVVYIPQTITPQEQTQARSNIGAASTDAATTTANGLMTGGDKAKLNGIAAGAQVNSVTSVNTKTGAVVINAADVGLGNVANKSEAQMVASGAIADALEGKLPSNARAADSEKLGGETVAEWQAKIDTKVNNSRITISAASPSGGVNGDLWFKL